MLIVFEFLCCNKSNVYGWQDPRVETKRKRDLRLNKIKSRFFKFEYNDILRKIILNIYIFITISVFKVSQFYFVSLLFFIKGLMFGFNFIINWTFFMFNLYLPALNFVIYRSNTVQPIYF